MPSTSENLPINPPVFSELGATGLRQYAGYVNEEWLPNLWGTKAVKVYREMSDNDAIVGAVLYAVEMMMRQTEWRVDPASKKPLDAEAANHVEECMNDMEHSWADTISEMLSFLPYGWSLHEIVYKKRNGDSGDLTQKSKFNDGMIGWRKMPIRSQDSLMHWIYDEEDPDRLLGMLQNVQGIEYRVPLAKSLLFRTKIVKNNPEGRSVLRNAYRAWYLKKKIEEVEAVGIDRDLVGLPVLTPRENQDIFDASDPKMIQMKGEAEMLVRNIRIDAQQGVVLPFGWTLELLGGNGRKTIDVGTTIQRWDARIAMTLLADFIILGHSESGTYEMHKSKVSNFASAIGSYLDMMKGIFNTDAVPKLLALNPRFASIEEPPTIEHSAVETPDLKDLADFLHFTVGTGAIKPDHNLENHLRTLAELPEAPDEPEEPVAPPPPEADPTDGGLNVPPVPTPEGAAEQGVAPPGTLVKRRVASGDWAKVWSS